MPDLDYRTANEAVKECQGNRDSSSFSKDFGKLDNFLHDLDDLNTAAGKSMFMN